MLYFFLRLTFFATALAFNLNDKTEKNDTDL